MPAPSLGRDVIFHGSDGGADYAAKITQLNVNGTVDLVTFGPNSLYFQHAIKFGLNAGEWSWPPREGEVVAEVGPMRVTITGMSPPELTPEERSIL